MNLGLKGVQRKEEELVSPSVKTKRKVGVSALRVFFYGLLESLPLFSAGESAPIGGLSTARRIFPM